MDVDDDHPAFLGVERYRSKCQYDDLTGCSYDTSILPAVTVRSPDGAIPTRRRRWPESPVLLSCRMLQSPRPARCLVQCFFEPTRERLRVDC